MTEPSFLHTTRAAYDRVAADCAERFHAELAATPPDRAHPGLRFDEGSMTALDLPTGAFVHARLLREPDGAVEKVQRAYLLARRPVDDSR